MNATFAIKQRGLALFALALTFWGLAIAGLQEANAHRAKSIFTTVAYSDEQTLQITHQIHLHDAQQSLSIIQNMREADLLDTKGQARLLLHLEKSFKIEAHGAPLALEAVGAEIEGHHLYIYFESDTLKQPSSITIQNDMLMDVYFDQLNQVNLNIGGKRETLFFKQRGKKLTAKF